MATLLAVCRLAKLTDEHGDLPKLQQALTADATAAMGAALHLLTRRAKEIKPAAYALAGLFLLHYLFP